MTFSCNKVGPYFDGTIRGLKEVYMEIIKFAVDKGMERPTGLDDLDWENVDQRQILEEMMQEAEDYINDHVADDKHVFGWFDNWPGNWGYFPLDEHERECDATKSL